MTIQRKKPTREKSRDVETNNPETLEMRGEFIRNLYASALRRAQDAMEQRTGEMATLLGEGQRVDIRKLVLEITGEIIPDALAEETAVCCSMKKLDDLIQIMPVDTISIEVGRGLMPLVDPKQGCCLMDRCASIRQHLALELGILVPGIRFRDNLQLKPNSYRLRLKEIEVATGEVILNHFLAIAPLKRLMRLPGELTTDPTYGMPGKWIPKNLRGKAERLGCMIFDPVSVIATHLTDMLRSRAAELLGLQEVHSMLEKFRKTHPAAVSEVYPSLLPLRKIRHIFQNLVKERVSLRDPATILEILADHAERTQNVEALTEYVRRGLSRVICREYMNNEGVINVIMIPPGMENTLSPLIEERDGETSIDRSTDEARPLLAELGERVQSFEERGLQPIFLCGPSIRPAFSKLARSLHPLVVVLSRDEIAEGVKAADGLKRFEDRGTIMDVVSMDSPLEEWLSSFLKESADGYSLTLDEKSEKILIAAIDREIGKLESSGVLKIILCGEKICDALKNSIIDDDLLITLRAQFPALAFCPREQSPGFATGFNIVGTVSLDGEYSGSHMEMVEIPEKKTDTIS